MAAVKPSLLGVFTGNKSNVVNFYFIKKLALTLFSKSHQLAVFEIHVFLIFVFGIEIHTFTDLQFSDHLFFS